jgi:hypothetical protein
MGLLDHNTELNPEDLLRLYSISRAASILHINEDSLNELIDIGKIGYLLIGKRKKISYKELAKYEEESLVKKSNDSLSEGLSAVEINRILKGGKIKKDKTLKPREILNSIMKVK